MCEKPPEQCVGVLLTVNRSDIYTGKQDLFQTGKKIQEHLVAHADGENVQISVMHEPIREHGTTSKISDHD